MDRQTINKKLPLMGTYEPWTMDPKSRLTIPAKLRVTLEQRAEALGQKSLVLYYTMKGKEDPSIYITQFIPTENFSHWYGDVLDSQQRIKIEGIVAQHFKGYELSFQGHKDHMELRLEH